MKKILYVVPSITRNNGIITFLYNYLNTNALRNEFEYTIFSSDKHHDDIVEMLRSLGVKIYFYKENLRPVKSFIESIKTFYKTHQFDIVHLNLATIAYFHIKYIKKYNKEAKIIMHSHATKFSSNKKKAIVGSMLYKLCSRHIDYRFACSDLAGKHLYKNKDFTIIYNALDNSVINKGENLRDKYNLDKDTITVGLIGRVSEQKNPFYIISLAKKLPKHTFFIIGDGNLLESMKKEAKLNNLDNIIFLGSVDSAKELYYNFDFIVMPSLFEGLPLVALEAQQQQIYTVLSTNITKEVEISNYVKFIDLNNIDEWINTLNNKVTYEFKYNAEYNNYNLDIQANRLKDIYNNILGGNNER